MPVVPHKTVVVADQDEEDVVAFMAEQGRSLTFEDFKLVGDLGEPVDRILKRLRDQGCVETEGRGPGKRYALTDMGRGMLDVETITTVVRNTKT